MEALLGPLQRGRRSAGSAHVFQKEIPDSAARSQAFSHVLALKQTSPPLFADFSAHRQPYKAGAFLLLLKLTDVLTEPSQNKMPCHFTDLNAAPNGGKRRTSQASTRASPTHTKGSAPLRATHLNKGHRRTHPIGFNGLWMAGTPGETILQSSSKAKRFTMPV